MNAVRDTLMSPAGASNPATECWVIKLREGMQAFWCGYEPNPADHGIGCHLWKTGIDGARDAVRFFDERSAHRAGVGAPNTPYGRADTAPDRGVKIVKLVHWSP